MPEVKPPLFSADDADRAHDEWGANCGPGAIAAICGLTLDQLRPQMGDFEEKHYTNPTLMWDVLKRLGVRWRLVKPPRTWPSYGLARVQWEGPWTEPGVPPRVAYRHTHWIGACQRSVSDVGIFDINAIDNGTGWVSVTDWVQVIVPHLTAHTPRANGRWHLTHVVEVQR